MKNKVFWFVVGSQHLYGEETLKQVIIHSKEIAEHINAYQENPCIVKFKDIVTTPDEILRVCKEANQDESVAGIITWMHTFSPAKMWIKGLKILNKSMLHLHTQYNQELPWDKIDMDFMNLNQSAHGDREFGFINTRLRLNRKVVVGHWKDEDVLKEIASWERVAATYDKSRKLKVARFGDNMRQVAVTEGDKVEAEIKLGWSINGYGIGDLVKIVNQVSEKEIDNLVLEYKEKYIINTTKIESIREQAKIEIALERFLKCGGFNAFTTTFEDLHGLNQLPGLAVQRLMEKGYGFGAEGDWKLGALTALMKYMAQGLDGGTSFMEDYTYHLEKGNKRVLGAHMLEVCPSIALDKPRIEVHPLGIGGKDDPARMVFNSKEGQGIMVTLVDLGDRFRMIANKINLKRIPEKMPNLPVARSLWEALPDFKTSATAWIYAGGAHHSVLTTSLSMRQLQDFAIMADIEFITIDENTDLNQFENELRMSDVIWKLKGIK